MMAARSLRLLTTRSVFLAGGLPERVSTQPVPMTDSAARFTGATFRGPP